MQPKRIRTLLAALLLAGGLFASAQPGSRDFSFNPGSAPDQEIISIARQPDGSIIAVGKFQNFGGHSYVARLSSNGTIDSTFAPQPSGPVYCVAIQGNGKIIIGGEFNSISGTSAHGLARLNADGTVDPSFAPAPFSLATRPEAILVQPDGRIVVGGSFTDYGDAQANRIVRLNSDGSIDATFQSGEGFNRTVHQLLRQPDGKIIAVGAFDHYYNSSTERGGIARINTDGSNDAAFSPNGGVAGYGYQAFAAALQSDGKIVVGGSFSYFSNLPADHIARLNTDGSRDLSFVGSANSDVFSVQVQPDDKILVGGFFYQLNDAPHSYFGRLLPDGQSDPTFSANVDGTNGFGYVNAVLLQPDTRIVVAGLFSGYNGSPAGDIVRVLNVLPSITTGVTAAGLCAGGNVAVSYSVNTAYTAGNVFTAQLSDASGSFAAPVSIGSVSTTGSGSIIAAIPANTAAGSGYRIRVVASSPAFNGSDNGNDLALSQPGSINAAGNQAFCAGSATTPLAFGGVNVSDFTWTNSNPAIGLPASGNGNLPSFVPVSDGVNTARATITVRAGSYCAVKAISFVISVRPRPDVTLPGNQSLCAGSSSTPVAFSGSLAGTTFSWTNNNTATGLAAAGSGNIPAFTTVNNSGTVQTSTLNVTPFLAGCTGDMRSFAIQVSPAAGSIAYPQSNYCQAGTAYVTRSGSAGGAYTASPAGLSLNGNTGVINLSLSTPGTYTITYTVAAQGACAASASTEVTINPQATVNPVPNQVYCQGVTTTPVVFGGSAASYSWTNDNTSIGLGASGTGNLPSFTTANSGTTTQYAYIKVTAQGNGTSTCTAKPVSFRITVNYCAPVTQQVGTDGDASTARTMLAQQFTAGPNPARNSLQLQQSGKSTNTFTVQLVNQYGTPVGTAQTFTGNAYTLDLTNVTPGAYLLQVTEVKSGISFSKQVVKL